MPYSNPVVGGNTLIREAIQSPDFVSGISGWQIARDGTAEFNNASVRGMLDIEGTDGSRILIYNPGSAKILIRPPIQGFLFNDGSLQAALAQYVGFPGTYYGYAILASPVENSVVTAHQSSILLKGGDHHDNTSFIQLVADALTCDPGSGVQSPIEINVGFTSDSNPSAGFTTTETQTDSITFQQITGKRYRITWSCAFQSTVSGDIIQFGLRQDTSGGTRLGTSRIALPTLTIDTRIVYEYYYVGTATGSKTIVATAVRTGGTGTITRNATVNQLSTLNVTQCS